MEEKTEKKSPAKKFILAGVIGALVIGSVIYISSRGYEKTDNAQLDGDLLSIRAGLSGYIEDIRFKDNQEVKKGDTLVCF
ncbi:MAG: hypothetical protein DI538_15875, partial [Azospira oryzae]